MKYWPKSTEDLIAGDMNAHSSLWDNSLEEGNQRRIEVKRGELIEEWMEENHMTTLNDGAATHTNRRTGGESTPDMTIVHSSQQDRHHGRIYIK